MWSHQSGFILKPHLGWKKAHKTSSQQNMGKGMALLLTVEEEAGATNRRQNLKFCLPDVGNWTCSQTEKKAFCKHKMAFQKALVGYWDIGFCRTTPSQISMKIWAINIPVLAW